MVAPPNIRDIKSTQTRNLIRGLLTRDPEQNVVATFDHLRESTNPDDAEIVARLLLTSPLFAHLALPEPFPNEPKSASSFHRVAAQHIECELAFQCIRFEQHSKKLVAALNDLQNLNEQIVSGEPSELLRTLKQFIENYGYSTLLLGKLSYVSIKFEDREDIKAFCGGELSKYGLSIKNPVALASVDMMGETYSFLPLRKNFMDFVGRKRTSQLYKDVVSWQFRPIRYGDADLASQMQSHGSLSLIDSLSFICTHLFNVAALQGNLAAIATELIPQSLQNTWVRLAESMPKLEQILLPSDEPEFVDFTFYRQSIGWIEYKAVSQFRNGIDPYYQESSAEMVLTGAEGQAFAEEYFSVAADLESISLQPSTYKVSLERCEPNRAGLFTRTAAFIYLLKKGANAKSISPEQMLTLFNCTRDISLLATVGELREFFAECDDDRLIRYLSSALIADCSKLNTDQHALRRALQEIVMKQYEGDLIAFANFLASRWTHVAAHLYSTCTESFLIQLFFLFEEPNEVFETRARFHDWYAEKFNDNVARDRAKTLRLDQKLQTIRGEIDDTRIYVDPLRFGQWLEDNTLEELSSLFKAAEVNPDDAASFSNFSDFATNRRPEIRLAIVFQAAFQEFCGNKRYGVDSYIGRRIRHGTLRGFMVSQVEKILLKPQYAPLRDQQRVEAKLTAWLRRYEGGIEQWGREAFHIASKQKPKGMISFDITAHSKIDLVRVALGDMVSKYLEHNTLIAVHLVIYDHCWRLIERDLQGIRNEIDTARLNWGMLSREELSRVCDDEDIDLVTDICREVNTLTDERFRTLSRWFTRPANLAPSAPVQLLFDAVIEEVKVLFPDFQPDIQKEGLSDIQIVGASYHHLYDFLYVVIHNAARHGNRSGRLVEDIQLVPVSPSIQQLRVTICSEFARGSKLEEVKEEIDAAMAGSIEDAMVIEGRSGMKKLLRLKADVREVVDIEVFYGDSFVGFRCLMNLASG